MLRPFVSSGDLKFKTPTPTATLTLHLSHQAAGRPPPQGVPYEGDTYMAALDLLGGLSDGLRAGIEPLVAGSPLVAALPEACRDEAADVRQSAFALLGDLSR